MPDSWEYPYFCQWDLMFHAVAFALIDPATAKEQCMLLRSAHFTSPSAQTPAYEWALSDPNPPIGAWAAMRIYQIDRKQSGVADQAFCDRPFVNYCSNTAGGPIAMIAPAIMSLRRLPWP